VGNSKGYVTVVDESCCMGRERGKQVEEEAEGDSVYQVGGWE